MLDSNCQGVYDQGCDAGANDIYLCPIGITYSSQTSASCIYQKGGGKSGNCSSKCFTGTKSLNEYFPFQSYMNNNMTNMFVRN